MSRVPTWRPQTALERRVPRECGPSVMRHGYAQIASQKRGAWLKRHFYVPAAWTGCEEFACIKSVKRVRRVCWEWFSREVEPKVSREFQKRGRPKTQTTKERFLYKFVHQRDAFEVSTQMQDELLFHVLDEPRHLVPQEVMWFLLRRGTIAPDVLRSCVLEVVRRSLYRLSTDAFYASCLDFISARIEYGMELESLKPTIRQYLHTLPIEFIDAVCTLAASDCTVAARETLRKLVAFTVPDDGCVPKDAVSSVYLSAFQERIRLHTTQ